MKSLSRLWPRVLFSFGLLLITGAAVLRLDTSRSDTAVSTPTAAPVAAREAKQLSYKVVGSYPHDPRAFLQGLLWADNGFYESTGLNGQSSLRRVEFPSGKVLLSRKLPDNIFGEGLVLFDNRLTQITWQNNVALVYDKDTFQPLGQWRYDGEGWGITSDGKSLIMSDGSDTLTFRDPQSFAPLRQIKVTLNGRPLDRLNELEWIDGKVWANVWQTDLIVQIDPQSGAVVSYLDMTGLLPAPMRAGADVLNGIAYDAKEKRIFVGGKDWPKLFEISLITNVHE